MVWRLMRGWVCGFLPCFLLTMVLGMPPALASVHVYHERPGQTTLRSQQSFRDRNDQSWQAILFKRYRPDGLDGLYLRLVGFPGRVTVDPQQPLIITTGTAIQWQAGPKLDPPIPMLPNNTNQYDMADVIADLEKAIPLTLQVPLQGKGPKQGASEIVVPPYAVQEWRDLAAQTLDGAEGF